MPRKKKSSIDEEIRDNVKREEIERTEIIAEEPVQEELNSADFPSPKKKYITFNDNIIILRSRPTIDNKSVVKKALIGDKKEVSNLIHSSIYGDFYKTIDNYYVETASNVTLTEE